MEKNHALKINPRALRAYSLSGLKNQDSMIYIMPSNLIPTIDPLRSP